MKYTEIVWIKSSIDKSRTMHPWESNQTRYPCIYCPYSLYKYPFHHHLSNWSFCKGIIPPLPFLSFPSSPFPFPSSFPFLPFPLVFSDEHILSPPFPFLSPPLPSSPFLPFPFSIPSFSLHSISSFLLLSRSSSLHSILLFLSFPLPSFYSPSCLYYPLELLKINTEKWMWKDGK